MRMDEESFEYLLALVRPHISKQETLMRDAIIPEARFSFTRRYLATGNSFEDLKFSNAISAQAIGKIVIETCEAIMKTLKNYVKIPAPADEWRAVAETFQQKTGCPHCLGAIDEKHIHIRKPQKSGSYYFSYKKTFSIVLMAIVNADSEFLMIDVGANGRISGGGVFSNTKFYESLEKQELNIPDPQIVHPTGKALPYVLVGDDAFGLSEYLMKPFSSNNLTNQEELYNQKLSSTRARAEKASGILASRFRLLLNTIALSPEKTTKVVMACCYLHNFKKKRRAHLCSQTESSVSTQTAEVFMQLQPSTSRNPTGEAKIVRKHFCEVVNRLND